MPSKWQRAPEGVPSALLWEREGEGTQAGTRIVFKSPTAVQWFGKLCGGLSQGGELIGGFPRACWERERH